MVDRTNDRKLIYLAIGALVAIAVIFVGYSYKTSGNMDQSAANAGSSTSRQSPNGLQEQPAAAARGPTTGSNSNVPPASR